MLIVFSYLFAAQAPQDRGWLGLRLARIIFSTRSSSLLVIGGNPQNHCLTTTKNG